MKNKEPNQNQGTPNQVNGNMNTPLPPQYPQQPPQPPYNYWSPRVSKKSNPGRLVGIIVLAVVLLVGMILALIFMVYIPNRPENIYRRGLGSIGEGIEKFSAQQIVSEFKATSYKGHLKIQYPEIFDSVEESWASDIQTANLFEKCVGAQQGDKDDITFKFDGLFNTPEEQLHIPDSSFNLDVLLNSKEVAGLEMRSLVANNSLLPILYFNLSKTACIEAFKNLDEVSDIINFETVFDTWHKVDLSEYISESEFRDSLDELEDSLGNLDYNEEDSQEIIDILSRALQAYMFTSDPEKMVFQMDSLVDGKTDYKGTASHKYSTKINHSNMMAMSKQIRDETFDSNFYNQLTKDMSRSTKEQLEELLSDEVIEESVDDFIENIEVQIWVDSRTKLLRNMRFVDKNTTSSSFGSYFDLGLSLENKSRSITLEMQFTYFNDTYGCYNSSDADLYEDDCSYVIKEVDCSLESNEQDCLNADMRIDAGGDKTMIATLKPDNNESIILGVEIKIDSSNNMSGVVIKYEAHDLLEANKSLLVEFSLEATGLDEAAVIEAPAGAKPLEFENPLTALQRNQRNSARTNDAAYLRSTLITFTSNNSGRRPTLGEFSQSIRSYELNHLGLGDYGYISFREDTVKNLVATATLEIPNDGRLYWFDSSTDSIHTWQGNDRELNTVIIYLNRRCPSSGGFNDDLQLSYVVDRALPADIRNVAFVYMPEGASQPVCRDLD